MRSSLTKNPIQFYLTKGCTHEDYFAQVVVLFFNHKYWYFLNIKKVLKML
jgi:hypothetical protein